MAVTTEEILAAARELAGRAMTDGEEKILFPGHQQAVLYLSDTGRRLGARCQLHPALLDELRELLGEENVVLKQ